MTRNLKALGLALVAVFAMSVVVASTASAQVGNLGKITSDGAVTLKGTETGGAGANQLAAFGITIECPGSTYTGHKVKVTPHEVIPNNANEATITPTYVNCKDSSGNPITVDMNGCDYVFKDVTTKTANENTYTLLADVICPATKSIEVTGGFCTLKIGEQTNKAGFHLKNTAESTDEDGTKTKDDLDLTGEIKTIKASACGGLLNTEAAIEKNDVTIKGFSAAGAETGVTISD